MADPHPLHMIADNELQDMKDLLAEVGGPENSEGGESSLPDFTVPEQNPEKSVKIVEEVTAARPGPDSATPSAGLRRHISEFEKVVAANVAAAQRALSGNLDCVTRVVADLSSEMERMQAIITRLQLENVRLKAQVRPESPSEQAGGVEPRQRLAGSVASQESLGTQLRNLISGNSAGTGSAQASESHVTSVQPPDLPGPEPLPPGPAGHQSGGAASFRPVVPAEPASSTSQSGSRAVKEQAPVSATSWVSEMYVGAANSRSSTVSRSALPAEPTAPGGRADSFLAGFNDLQKAALKADQKNFSGVSRTSSDAPFEMLPVWKVINTMSVLTRQTSIMWSKDQRRSSLQRLTTSASNEHELMPWEEHWVWRRLQRLVVHPSSIWRGGWDVASSALLVYDAVTIPLQVFFALSSGFFSVMLWITRLFWTLDFAASMFTGFMRSDGSIEFVVPRIVRRYARTWLCLDLLVMAADWAGTVDTGDFSKPLRFVCCLRLIRFVRMRMAFKLIIDRVPERLVIFADIVQILLIILGSAHFAACVWYGIGNKDGLTETWVNQHLPGHSSTSYRYATSLHWSLSQLSGGMDEVVPHNMQERAYAISIFILDFVLAAVLISSLTSSMTKLHMLSNRQSSQLSTLRRFLTNNSVSAKLMVRVLQSAQHALAEQHSLSHESGVELLSMVSEPIRVELHFEMYMPILSAHPFFRKYGEVCPNTMRKICHLATSMLRVGNGDIIFNAGEIPTKPKMFFITRGTFMYLPLAGQDVVLKMGQWLAESTLWTAWMHRGAFQAVTDGMLCEVDAQTFAGVAGNAPHPDFDLRQYAARVIAKLNQGAHFEETSDLSPNWAEEAEETHFRKFPQRTSSFHASPRTSICLF